MIFKLQVSMTGDWKSAAFLFCLPLSDGRRYGLPAGYTEKSGGRGSGDAVAVGGGDVHSMTDWAISPPIFSASPFSWVPACRLGLSLYH